MGPPRRAWMLLAVAAALVLLSRVPFLPPTLEDIDSVNFALALREFNPALHQPHPPGFPVYVAVARAVNVLVPEPVRALALLSAVAQALLVLPLFLLFRALGASAGRAAAATALSLANPILWFNGARPMSDSLGLLFVVGTQVLLLHGAEDPRALVAGSAAAALAAGVRVQAALLTLPLMVDAMVRARRGRTLAALAFVAGLLAWIAPVLIESGGVVAYRAAFGSSLRTSLPVEPLATTFTLNRALKTALRVALAPWISVPLGAVVSVLAVLGLIVLAWRRSPALRPALLAFAPYLVAHFFFQQTRTLRYSMPYVPLVAWLAVEALAWISGRARVRVLTGAAVAGLAAWSAVRTIPALSEYHRQPSPPYAALQAVAAEVSRVPGFLVSGHYMFRRYLSQASPALHILLPSPGREIAQLEEHWRSGGAEPVLFLAEGDRTDLESVAASSRRMLRRWRWRAARRFFRGERPSAVELFRIDRPPWFAGEGWLLSLEAGALPALRGLRERRAFLAPREGPSFLLVSGQPTAPDAGEFELELALAGNTLDRRNCGAPLLRGYDLPPFAAGGGSRAGSKEGGSYAELLATTRHGGSPAGAPFALNGLAYGGPDEAGFVHGDGWFYPESDERAREFRWTSRRARSLLHVPPGGGRLVVEGLAPCEYVGKGLHVGVNVDGAPPVAAVLVDRPFRLEVDVPGGSSFREASLTSDRSFVPDRVQKNRDRRELALRVYDFRLEPRAVGSPAAGPRAAAPPPAAPPADAPPPR
jgi:hypothetical protein